MGLYERNDQQQGHCDSYYVIQGFHEHSEIQADSPTDSKESLRLLLSVISSNQLSLYSVDIHGEFLQGNNTDRAVFIEPPPEANCKNTLWKLEKCVYGLSDAERSWYFSEAKKLDTLNWFRSTADYDIFICYENDRRTFSDYIIAYR